MTPTMRKTAGSAALALALGGVVVGTGFVWRKYGGLDPYANLERKRRPFDPSSAIKATGVRIRHYENGRLTASADAKALTIGQDRNVLLMRGVRNGVAQSPQGPIQFAGKTAVLTPSLKSVTVSQGVRVKGGDFDVSAEVATVDGKNGVVTVPGALRGTIGGGAFSAASLVHKANSDYTRIGQPNWTGTIRAAEMPAAQQSRVWRIHTDLTEKTGTTDTSTTGWATDGDQIITAPTILHNSKTEVVTGLGKGAERATYRSAKADIVADKVVVYRNEHKAVCTGHVLMFVRPKKDWDKPLPQVDDDYRGPLVPDIPPALMAKMAGDGTMTQADKDKVGELRSSKNLRDYPMQMAADEVTYWYQEGERRAVAKNGNPTAFQKFEDGRWRQAWAPEARYDGEKDLLDLVGSKSKREVHMRNSVGDLTDGFAATLSTKEDQTEESEYAKIVGPKGGGIDFDADRPKSASGAAPAKGGAPPSVAKPGS